MPETGRLDGHARIHQGQRGTAGGSHGRRAVGLQDLGNHADGVRELVLGRDHRKQGALSQRTVTDLAALRSAHAARFAGAVRREIVLVHVALALSRVDGVKTLPLVEHAERGDGKRLGLTALEQAGAMNAGQVTGDDVQRADLVGTTAVGALAGFDDHGAHGLLLERLQGCGDVGAPSGTLLLVEGLLLDAGLELFDLAHASLLIGIAQSLRTSRRRTGRRARRWTGRQHG